MEISLGHEIHLTPSNDIARQNNIYELDIKGYDKFEGTQIAPYVKSYIELYFGLSLTEVYSIQALRKTVNSIWVRDDLPVLVNLPNHPHLYPTPISSILNTPDFRGTFIPVLNVRYAYPARQRGIVSM